MSNELTQMNNNALVWDDGNQLNEVRKLFAPGLTEVEFGYFVGLGKATGLNPFLREMWAVKYDRSAPAQVFIGRDGYRKAAQSHGEYDYHQCDAVYENDNFEVIKGEVRHSYTLKERGKLVGAYCISKRRSSSKPIYVFADLKEYTTGKSIWQSKPATMIKKVAESQCLRACFQDLFGGTYGEEEYDRPITKKPASVSNRDIVENGQTIDIVDQEPPTSEQIDELRGLIDLHEVPEEKWSKWLLKTNAERWEEMPKECIQKCIDHLKSKIQGE